MTSLHSFERIALGRNLLKRMKTRNKLVITHWYSWVSSYVSVPLGIQLPYYGTENKGLQGVEFPNMLCV